MKKILITSIGILSFPIFLNSVIAQYKNDVFIFQEHRFVIITLPPQIPFKIWSNSEGKGNAYDLDKVNREIGDATTHNSTSFPLFYPAIFPGTVTETSKGTVSSASKLDYD